MFYSLGSEDAASPQDLAKDMEGMHLKVLKERTADAVEKMVAPVRERYAEVIKDEKLLEEIAQSGAEKARASALQTMDKVRRAIGFA
ncbi:Tryptophan--tRNA ligase [Pseudocercospora fuligena]|uniref:Tryptophan--tRNA ligase n=1 Tax=Pseudocercospora fuligena TaxID=685502 RepID=A0A8H6VHL0_9PEZI|nr:Tryptophan--tRNA ligase [Pseudocercospora fuligena]